MIKKADCIRSHERQNGPVHQAFGLTYAAYLVVPRVALQGMPIWWQKLFIWLIQMMPETPEYTVLRRDPKTRKYMTDPWKRYKYGNIEELIAQEQANDGA